jgi:ABC-type branched-subunit amino acid transport system substrate-binding protein
VAALVAVFALVTAACGSRLTPQQRAEGIRLLAGQKGGTTTGGGGGAATTTAGGGGGGSITPVGTTTGGGGGTTTTTTGGGGGTSGHGPSAPGPSGGGTKYTSKTNGGSTDTGVTGTTINLATVYDGQGPEPGIFNSAFHATEAAAAYINSTGGLFGRQLHVDPIDDHTNSAENRAAVETACSKDFAMVGSMSAFDDGGVPVAQKCGIPDMPAIPVTQQHELDKSVHAAYPNRPDYFIEAFPRYIKQHYPSVIKKAGIIWLNASATQTNEAAREKAYKAVGFDFKYRQQVQVVEPNFAPYVAAMRQQGVQYVTMVSDYQSIARLLQAMQQQNWFPQVMDWDSVVYDQRFLQLAGSAANNSLFYMDVAPFEEAAHNPEVALYEYWLHKTCSGSASECTPTYFGEYAWSAIRLFQKAALAVGAHLTRKALNATLATIHQWNDYGLSATHDPGRELPSPCIYYGKIENGKFVRVYPSSGFSCSMGGLLHQ